MARYSADHKAQTRVRLIETAREHFRRHGFDTLSIDKLMSAAGLTRGAFYAHFESKEALVREVLAIESGLVRALEALSSAAGSSDTAAVLEHYLSEGERAGRVQCPLVAHPMDALRGGEERARLYQDQVQRLVEALSREGRQKNALRVALTAVGAAVLSSAVVDPKFASQIESAGREQIAELLHSTQL